jgi:hypothetical protein
MFRRNFLCPMLLVSACIASGCERGPNVRSGVVITGRLLNNGQPMELVRPDIGLGMVQITLIPVGGKGVGEEGTQADKDGRFEIRGAGKGVPPSAYKLAVRHWKNGLGTKDELEDRFTPENTPIEIDIPSKSVGSKHDLGDIELSKYAMPKKSE